VKTVLRALSVPAGNDRGPLFMDQVLAAIHQGNPRKLPVTLIILRHMGEVALAVDFPDECRAVVEGQLYAHYPDAKLVSLSSNVFHADNDHVTTTATLELHPDLFPIRRYQQFEDPISRQVADPLTALFTAIATETTANLQASIHFTITPAQHRQIHRVQKCIRVLARPFFLEHHRFAAVFRRLALSPRHLLRWSGWIFGRIVSRRDRPAVNLHTSETRVHEREDDLVAANEKAGKLLFASTISIRVTAPLLAEAQALAKVHEIAATFGQFNAPRRSAFRLRTKKRRRSRAFLLATDELATLWHPATSGVQAPTMKIVESRETEPPVRLPSPMECPNLSILGQAVFRDSRQACGLLPDDRRRHLLIQGKTGMGKSTLLRRLIASDIAAGHGLALIDPHGDLCEAVVAAVPSHRTNDTILFDVTDTAHPLAFNILHCPNPQHRTLTATGIVDAFKKIWPEFFGPRMEYVFFNALLALLEVEGTTVVSLVRLLSEAKFREAIAARVSDPVVRHYWQRQFATMTPKFQAEVVAPVQNKVGQIVSSPLLRNILGQAKSTIDLRKAMDERKLLLVNLSKGRIGEIASSLLGSLLVTAIQQAAMTRAELAEEDRADFYLFIDEFQNFATESFATILSEARKYRLNLTIANQYLGQIEEATLDAVWGNIGSMVIFQVGVQDAEALAAQLGGKLLPNDLLTLPRYHAYARLLINGHPSRPFTLRTLPPASPSHNNRDRPEIIRRYCRQRYARPAPRVEQEIHRVFAGV